MANITGFHVLRRLLATVATVLFTRFARFTALGIVRTGVAIVTVIAVVTIVAVITAVVAVVAVAAVVGARFTTLLLTLRFFFRFLLDLNFSRFGLFGAREDILQRAEEA